MKKRIFTLIAIGIGLIFQSCEKDFEQNDNATNEVTILKIEDLNFTEKDRLREKFGRALVTALSESSELRQLIKSEALLKFNKDYDVLYQLIKNKPLNGHFYRTSGESVNYNSVRDLLLNYFDSESELSTIEQQLPLLTIMVPKLPNDSFSADNWDITDTTQNPKVGLRMDETNDVPILDANNDDFVLSSTHIPDFPVVVVKNNERLLSNLDSGYDSLTSSEVIETDNNLNYMFIDDNFNPNIVASNNGFVNNPSGGNTSNTPNWQFIEGRDLTVEQFLIDAYDVFDGNLNNPWQRDNIYFGLTPTNTNGALTNAYREFLTYFKLNGNPNNAYQNISQVSVGSNPDPIFDTQTSIIAPNANPWTDGFFEFRVWLTHGSKTDPNGTNTSRSFSVSPEDLFEITHHRSIFMFRPFNNHIYAYTPQISGIKPIDFYPNGFDNQKLQFVLWDIEDYSNKWTYRFEEVDLTVTNSISQTQSTKHNANVSFDPSSGEKTKFGLKFGASGEQTESTTRTWNWTEESDNLEEQTVFFWDNVLNKHPQTGKYYPNLYSTGPVDFEVRPIQTNF